MHHSAYDDKFTPKYWHLSFFFAIFIHLLVMFSFYLHRHDDNFDVCGLTWINQILCCKDFVKKDFEKEANSLIQICSKAY